MEHFTLKNQFLIPSFLISKEDEKEFGKFYVFLEKSGVWKVIERYIANNTSVGGRPNVNYFNLFAVIIYGFAFGKCSLRELEDACAYDIRYIGIMEQIIPSYSTIDKFINKVIVPNEHEIFGLMCKQIIKEMNITLDDAFIDGTKFEANANKYKFVWKPTTYHKKLSVTFFQILKDNNLCQNFRIEECVKSTTILLAIQELNNLKTKYSSIFESLNKSLNELLIKVLEYEEKEAICGENRKSYYKTDHDATAMCLKQDYYSGLGSNMHAGYNVQIMVVKGLVLSYYVSQSRADIEDFIPVIDKFYDIFKNYPKNICADAGYGSLENYKYLELHNIGNYVKYQSWEGNVSGTRPDSFKLNDDNTITCLDNKVGNPVTLDNRHPRKAGGVFYEICDCTDCKFKQYCMRFLKNIDGQTNRIFEINPTLIRLKQQSETNLLSPKGIELRINRSVQVEGVFGIEKQNYGYTRTRRRGLDNVSTEITLTLLGLNIKKLFKFYTTGIMPKFWEAPENLSAELFKKPSAKRLSKKGQKIHDKKYLKNQ